MPWTLHPTIRILLAGALLLLATLTVYSPAWHGKFIWDDLAHITKPELRSIEGLSLIWTDPHQTQQYYPLAHSAFWLQFRLWGENPTGYHIVNIVLHAVNALIVWRILSRLLMSGAMLAALIFALHPVHVESVAWITELKNTLSGFFYLSALLAYMHFDPPAFEARATENEAAVAPRNLTLYVSALLLFLLAALSKTVTASLPAALLLLIWWKRGRLDWRHAIPMIPFLVIGIVLGSLTVYFERTIWGAEGERFSFTPIERVLIAGRAVWFYYGKLVWPANLIFFYPRWGIDSSALWQYAFPIAAIALVCVLWALRRRLGRGPLVAALFFGGTLIPALGFFNLYWQVYTFVCDHVQYLGSLSIIALTSSMVATLMQRLGNWHKPAAWIICGAILSALAVQSWVRCHVYQDIHALWNDTIARNPSCWMAYNNLGVVYTEEGRYADAVTACLAAIQHKSDHAPAWSNLGLAYIHQQQYDKAFQALRAAVKFGPGYAEAYANLGLAFERTGQFAQAIRTYRAAIAIKPTFVGAYINLGVAHYNMEEYDQAISAYESALSLRPHSIEALNNLAWIHATVPLSALQDGAKAVELAERALALIEEPDAILLGTLAAAKARAGRFREAADAAQRAMTLASSAGDSAFVQATSQRLKLYQSGMPYTEMPRRNEP